MTFTETYTRTRTKLDVLVMYFMDESIKNGNHGMVYT